MKIQSIILILVVLNSWFYSNEAIAQTDFDHYKLEGMDVFSRPDLFGQDYAAFNGLGRTEKLQILEEAGMQDSTWTHPPLPREDVGWENKWECGEYAKQTAVNMFGCKNLDEWQEKDKFDLTKNGKYNIPVFMVAVLTTPGPSNEVDTIPGGHFINGVFAGPENPGEKADPTKFEQWVFFEPQKEGIYYVTPGDFSMNANGPAHIYWFGWKPNASGDWKHSEMRVIEFNLEEGVPHETNINVSPYLLEEDPHTTTIKLSQLENKVVERDSTNPDTSPGFTGTPSVETNLEHYSATVNHVDKDTTYLIDSEHPEYYSFTRQFMADTKMGRWSASNLSNLGDTTEHRITVDDTILPEGFLNGYNVLGDKGSNPGTLAKSVVEDVFDASPYPVDTLTTFSETPTWEDDTYFYYNVDVSLKDVSGNENFLGTVEAGVRKNYSGIEEAVIQEGFELELNYPNPVTAVTTIQYYVTNTGYVTFEIYNLNGTLLEKKVDYAGYNGEYKIQLDMRNYLPGTYLLKAIKDNTLRTNFIIKK